MSLLLLEVPHLPTLCLPLRAPPACIPPLFKLVHLAPHLPMQRSTANLLTFFRLLRISSLCTLLTTHVFGRFPITPASSSSPDTLEAFQWNARDLQAKIAELLHFISSPPVDLICIQESNLYLSSSFRILGFSAL